MSGPPPKHPAVRQRRNRVSTVAVLGGRAPVMRELPERPDGLPWHPDALAMWRLAWASPMAAEYVDADVPGLQIVADLTHRYWTKPDDKTAAELRQQRAAYGLDPLARRRLQWSIEPAKPEAAAVEPPTRPRDPRLRSVS